MSGGCGGKCIGQVDSAFKLKRGDANFTDFGSEHGSSVCLQPLRRASTIIVVDAGALSVRR